MKPTRSYKRPVVQKITMITIVLCVLILSTMYFIEPKDSKDERENNISIIFEPNKEPLILKEETNSKEEVIDEVAILVNSYEKTLDENMNLINFYANLFNIPVDIILDDLKTKSVNEKIIDINNLGFLKDEDNNLITHANIDLGLIAYFENYIENNPIYRKNKIEPYKGTREYVEELIAYFTNVYSDVDYNIAVTIGAAESGYYTAKGMLSVNNIYGGMYNDRLIRYHNIEYGVYKYIRLLNNNYFGKGLNTFELIGKYYCPTTINGVTQASPHWLSLVNNIKHKYGERNIVTIEDVISLK